MKCYYSQTSKAREKKNIKNKHVFFLFNTWLQYDHLDFLLLKQIFRRQMSGRWTHRRHYRWISHLKTIKISLNTKMGLGKVPYWTTIMPVLWPSLLIEDSPGLAKFGIAPIFISLPRQSIVGVNIYNWKTWWVSYQKAASCYANNYKYKNTRIFRDLWAWVCAFVVSGVDKWQALNRLHADY